MIKKSFTSILFTCICFFAYIISYAQDAQQPQLYFVEDVVVKPSERGNFQEVVKEFLNYFEEHNFEYPVNSYMTSDFHIYFTFPLNGFADIGNLFTNLNEMTEKVGSEKWAELTEAEFKGIETYEYGLYNLRPDLSYIPENPRLAAEESNYLEWTFAYVKPGKDAEAEVIWKKWVELYKAKDISDPYYCWTGLIGPELPLYLFVFSGENAIDFHQNSSAIMEKLGEDASPLYEETFKLIKKMEIKTGWVLRDLTYTPNSE